MLEGEHEPLTEFPLRRRLALEVSTVAGRPRSPGVIENRLIFAFMHERVALNLVFIDFVKCSSGVGVRCRIGE